MRLFSWRSPWPELVSRSGAYSDLFFYQKEPIFDFCFFSIATDSSVVGSIELTQIDANAYPFNNSKNSSDYILINYGRFSSGSDQRGPGFSIDPDIFGRTWQSDAKFCVRSAPIANGATIQPISTFQNIAGVEKSPNYFPEKLHKTAVTASGNEGGVLEYELLVDGKLDYLLWFHCEHIDVNVTNVGQRLFEVIINGENVNRVDLYKEVGGFAAYDWSYAVKSLSSTTLSARLESVVGAPIICGLENFAIVPVDIRTVSN